MKEDRTKYFLPIFVGVLAFGEGMNANLFFAMMAGAMLALYMTLRLMQKRQKANICAFWQGEGLCRCSK